MASRPSDRFSSTSPTSAAPTGGADLVVGDLVGQQGIELGGFGGGVAEAGADGLEGHPGVDQLGGVGMAELVDVEVDAGGGAVEGPPVLGGVVGQALED
jgi:hypothetical protein